jgi:hypothetical protein
MNKHRKSQRCLAEHRFIHALIHEADIVLCNMADVVISELLCFLFNKLGKTPVKNLKAVIVDFYNADDIWAAKELFFKELHKIGSIEVPRLVRRKGETRGLLDTDDLFTVVSLVDESSLLSSLPVFAAGNLDKVPYMRPEDLDLCLLVKKLHKLEETVSVHGTLLSELANCDKSVEGKVEALAPTENQTQEVKSGKFIHKAKPSGGSGGDDGLETVDAEQDGYQSVSTRKKNRHKPTVGKKDVSDCKVKAAKEIVSKAVFHVDNLDSDCTDTELVNYIQSCGINVLSCFSCKSWRTDEQVQAFRVCIDRSSTAFMTAENSWPRSVIVRPWKFKDNSKKSSEKVGYQQAGDHGAANSHL